MITKSEAIEPSDFDLVVLGTGLVESLVAAAASKAGKSVLQLDPGPHYGGCWAAQQLDEFVSLLGGATEEAGTAPDADGSGSLAHHGITGATVLRDASAELGPSNQYNLDLAPKMVYGAGPLIDLLLGSGAHHYTEFKLVQGSYMLEGSELRPVPASRSEVFKDRRLALAQKRALMKFLKGCTDALRGEGHLQGCFDGRPFAELMRAQGLEPQLQALLLHAVLMQDHTQHAQQGEAPAGAAAAAVAAAPPQGSQPAQVAALLGAAADANGAIAPTGTPSAGAAAAPVAEAEALSEEEGQQTAPGGGAPPITAAAALLLMDVFMRSVGRYGQDAGPFLTPMYGCGELPQAFCRVAAVAGAVHVLRCPVDGPLFDEHTFSCIGVELGTGQVIRCQHLAAGEAFLQEWISTFHPSTEASTVHRCTAILDGPLVAGEHQTAIVIPPGVVPHAEHAVRGLALSSSTKVCPDGRYLLHLWTPAPAAQGAACCPSALEVLQSALETLVDTSHLQHSQQQQAKAAVQEAAQPLQQQQPPQEEGEAADAPAAADVAAGPRSSSQGTDPPYEPTGSSSNEAATMAAGPATAASPLTAAQPPSGSSEAGPGSALQPTSGAPAAAAAAAAACRAEGVVGEGEGEGSRPRALLAAFFSHHRTAMSAYTQAWPSNTVLCPGPDHTATFLSAVGDAKDCFARLYPDIQPFPLEPPQEEADAGSDDEALEALEAALGKLPAGEAGEEE